MTHCRESGLLQQDLSALSNEDLVLFGVTDEATRDEMVSQFTTTPNQLMNYDKFVWQFVNFENLL